MRCYECGKGTMKKKEGGLYRFSELGLPNVYFKDVERVCSKCKEVTAIIPKMGPFLDCIAWIVATKPTMLTGDEIQYLRKNLGQTQEQFAKLMGISRALLARWESGARNPGKANDRQIRMFYLALQEGELIQAISDGTLKDLVLYFGTLGDEQRSPRTEIDPAKCSPKKLVRETLQRIRAA